MTSSVVEPVVQGHGRPAEGRAGASDVAGVLILGGCAVWALIAAMGRPARPEGVLLAVLAVAAGYACGRMAGSLLPVTSTAAAGLAGLALACISPHGITGHEGPGAAQLTLATGAVCCAAWAAPHALRPALWLLAAAVTLTAVVGGSTAGAAASGAVLLCSLAAARPRRLPALAACALIAAVAVGSTWAVAKDAVPGGLPSALRAQLTEHRVRLWQDAARIGETDWVRGVGPDRFGELSSAAARPEGLEAKPHSAPLQQAVGQGLPGVALLGAAFGWLLHALWRSLRPTPVVLTAAATLTALAVESCLGNALSFSEITAGAGLLAGLATASRLDDGPGTLP
ncbi:O-antigen ligase family protein [Streptomyces sp. S465]|uniref:O-antigen ligase family protein n=1 Tax=Streptomyces sp. S465 TaxID=2979468 RepID=UPI0022A86076|nr:O-antigen ligase family protein [Streptomyces sp. S465]WAP54690.1 O-antigen ligase family protein [Streptomyces sp. S465]